MSQNDELKRLAESLPQLPWSYEANGFILAWDGTERSRCENVGGFYCVCEGVSNFREYLLALEPAKVLALIAENERLTNRLEVDPRHDYDGISTRDATVHVLAMIAEIERLKKFEDWFSRLETATTAIDESFRDERDLALFSVFWAARLFMVPTEVIESGDEDYCEKLIRSGAETLMVGGRRLRDAAEKDEKGKPVIPFDWQYRSARELAQ